MFVSHLDAFFGEMSGSLAHFLSGPFIFLVLSCMSCLYIFEINYLSVVSFAIIFSHSEGCLFTLLIVSFVVQKFLSLIRSHFFKILFYLTLQYCIGFAMYQNESATGIHVFPILNPPPSSLPYHPSGSSQCTSPKHPVSCIEPGLETRFILYMFQRPSSKSSHPLPLPPSPKKCSIHQCLFCCLVYRGIVTIFLNSIYMC